MSVSQLSVIKKKITWARNKLLNLFPKSKFIHLSCRYIDQGRNPQLYTKDCLEKALEKNQQVNGKIDAYKVCILFDFDLKTDDLQSRKCET